jgi:hypothetical protein
MKLRFSPQLPVLVALLSILPWTVLTAHGAANRTNPAPSRAAAKVSNATPISNAATMEPEIPRSVFVWPKTDKEGKDPFFPRSQRPFVTVSVAPSTNPAPPTVDLKINGTSGSEERPLVIINNLTFGIGDSGDVVSGNRRIRIQCVEIDLSAGRATVQVGSERRVLYFQKSGK